MSGAGATNKSGVGFVAIGRNEGDRLKACLRSIAKDGAAVVYVDSGSTDGSVAFAESLGVHVVALDLDQPFTAARARNEGVARLLEVAPEAELVQFLDGDCEMVDGWVATAVDALQNNEKLGVVCGRRRERFPEASIYNRLCDMEWDTPVGEAKYCGGDAMFRLSAWRAAGGYNPTLIAGEEPELCVRLRQSGWKIERLDAEMTLHDAAMTKFSQFWKRAKRAGHAYAEGAALHGGPPEHHWVKEVRSIETWGMQIPSIIFLMFLLSCCGFIAAIFIPIEDFSEALSLPITILFLFLLFYVLLFAKVTKYRKGRGDSWRHSALYAGSVVVGKFANAAGVRMYRRNAKRGERGAIIEYKNEDDAGSDSSSERVGVGAA